MTALAPLSGSGSTRVMNPAGAPRLIDGAVQGPVASSAQRSASMAEMRTSGESAWTGGASYWSAKLRAVRPDLAVVTTR